jgi:hypothetical protein
MQAGDTPHGPEENRRHEVAPAEELGDYMQRHEYQEAERDAQPSGCGAKVAQSNSPWSCLAGPSPLMGEGYEGLAALPPSRSWMGVMVRQTLR